MSADRVLVYRLGSIGDTVVALPSLHLIARAFPRAERRLLTNLPDSGKAAPVSSVLGDSGLADGYFFYRAGARGGRQLWALRRAIRRWDPRVLIYLAEPRGLLKAWRDACFFRACGVRRLVGVPFWPGMQENRWIASRGRYEHEAERLARCLRPLGESRLEDESSWDLHLTEEEAASARCWLARWAGRARFIACGLGAKVEVKDWGTRNWQTLLERLSLEHPGLGLVTVGAASERDRSDLATEGWRGPRLNLCGRLTPRESAAVLRGSLLFLGHDGGPMHLAVAAGVRCVAIFSGHSKPGRWFPYGSGHQVVQHRTSCWDCGLDVCERHQKKCMTSIEVAEVLDRVRQGLVGGGSSSLLVEPRSGVA